MTAHRPWIVPSAVALLVCAVLPLASAQTPATRPTPIFQTNFEGDARVEPSRGSDDKLVGRDATLPTHSDPAEELAKRWGVTEFSLQYTGGDASLRSARIAPDPVNPANKVLHFQIKEGWLADGNAQKARVQANLYALKPGLKSFHQSVRVFVPEGMNEIRQFPKVITWLTIAEFWNDEWWSQPKGTQGFRVTAGIGKNVAGESDLVFTLEAQRLDPANGKMPSVWHVYNNDLKVPIGKWFTLEYLFVEGDASTGRFQMIVTPDGGARQVAFDVNNFTRSPLATAPDGITHWNPLKLYTSAELANWMKARGKSLELYFDDLRISTGDRP